VVPADGSSRRQLTKTGGWACWWPNGNRLDYLNLGTDGAEHIFTVALEGGPPQIMSGLQFRSSNNPFDVAPDGTSVAISDSLDVSSEIWLLRPMK
jgi:Tol biopolymer transport system component